MTKRLVKTFGICLRISPWSKTSHIVTWLVPSGIITTAVKGANRPKSAFLGQYDLNYTCEIIYYDGEHKAIHALKECSPLRMRENLRTDWMALVLCDRFRFLAEHFTPNGKEAEHWFLCLSKALDALNRACAKPSGAPLRQSPYSILIAFEMKALDLLGLKPRIVREGCEYFLRGERAFKITESASKALEHPFKTQDVFHLAQGARALGLYYLYTAQSATRGRRQVLKLISQSIHRSKQHG